MDGNVDLRAHEDHFYEFKMEERDDKLRGFSNRREYLPSLPPFLANEDNWGAKKGALKK